MEPTYTREEVIDMFESLDREALNILCMVLNEEQTRYTVKDWIMLKALIDYRYQVVSAIEVRQLRK